MMPNLVLELDEKNVHQITLSEPNLPMESCPQGITNTSLTY